MRFGRNPGRNVVSKRPANERIDTPTHTHKGAGTGQANRWCTSGSAVVVGHHTFLGRMLVTLVTGVGREGELRLLNPS